MQYFCQICGVTADDAATLCDPIHNESNRTLCNAPEAEVCKDKEPAVKYTCDACGSVSANQELLCNPSRIR